MNSVELEEAVRRTMSVGTAAAFPDLTQQRIFDELNDKLHTAFEDLVVHARSGYWLHETVFNTTVGRNRYRIPPRAVVGGLESVEIAVSGTTVFYQIDQIPIADVGEFEGAVNRAGQPYVYVVQGDQVEFLPTPNTIFPIRFKYYARPSTLVLPQNNTPITGGTDRGRVVSKSSLFPDITVNALPFDMSLAVPAVITDGVQKIDVVHPNGWHELAVIDAVQAISGGLTFTLQGATVADTADVQVGDYVRVAEQTDWPCLPDDFHRCLADATAVKMLLELHLTEKSQVIAENNGNDMARFKSLLYPRVRSAPKQIGIMRRSRFGASWPYGRIWG